MGDHLIRAAVLDSNKSVAPCREATVSSLYGWCMMEDGLDPRTTNLSTMLRRSALRNGSRTAILCGETSWSYADLDQFVDRLAYGLRLRGISHGDRVAVLARNSHIFVAIRFATARCGAVLVPINFMLNADEVTYILDHSGARFLFVDETTVAVGRQAAAATAIEAIYAMEGEAGGRLIAEDLLQWTLLLGEEGKLEETARGSDLAQIIYTSGTEARPKGAMLSHEAVLWQYQSCVIDCEWTRDTVALHALPLFHCAQLDAMLGPALMIGARNIITAQPTPDNLLTLLVRHQATSFFAPPTIWISLLRSEAFDPTALAALKKGYYGASIMPVEVLRELSEYLPSLRLWNLYGQTEIAPVATILFPHEHSARPGSAGRATLHVETRVVDEAMHDVAVGEIGEVVHRSPQLLLGYWRDEQKTTESFEGGWFHSGDLATIDAEGYITIVDRKKDMIKTGGENVSSREVEEVIYRHPAVSEVAVIGLPHERWIEAVTAVVVPRKGFSLGVDELIAHCRKNLASYKLPKQVVVLDGLPRNASGKILKRELRIKLRGSA